MPDWRRIPPLAPEDRPERPEFFSQTFLGRMSVCPHSAMLYRRHQGGAGSHAMDRGTAIHLVWERMVRLMVEQGERSVPPELAKDIAADVLAERKDLVIPAHEADAVRVMAYHLAEGVVIDPAQVVAIEQSFVMELAGVLVRGRVDVAFAPAEDRLEVWDIKSSLNVPAQEEFEQDFQRPAYGCLLAFGTPEGSPFGIGRGVNSFELVGLYPRYLSEQGIAERRTTVSRQELVDHRLYLEALIGKAEHGFETGEWPAVPGSHCSSCAAPSECPLPARLRDFQGAIDGPEAAEQEAMLLALESKRIAARKKALKGWATENGVDSIPAGSDQEFGFTYSESRQVVDLDALLMAVEDARRYGTPLDAAEHVRTRKSTRFDVRKVKNEVPA